MPKKFFEKKQVNIRKAAVAGMFYPEEKRALKNMIKGFLDKAEEIKIEAKPKILIVPHAGYEYSGQTAGYGFKQLEGVDFRRVVLIGPSHTDWFDGLALSDDDIWQTPLGDLEVDSDFLAKLAKENKKIFYRQSAHSKEHCLEVELPFLQTLLKDFKIAPIVMGEPTLKNAEILADSLAKNIDSKTLIVISSDLSHYPSYELANQIDKKTIGAILSGEAENFEKILKETMNQNLESLDTCACGEGPIKAGLILAERLGLKKIKLLKYVNSGDITGDYSRVVGYASIAFFKESEKTSAFAEKESLSEDDKKELLALARQSIEVYLKEGKMPEFATASERLKQPRGAFVTLRKKNELRGCIGRLEAPEEEPLYKIVAQMAAAAATQDARFYSVRLEELKDIKIEISVLSPLKKIKSPFQEIELGRHGVAIKNGFRSGVFLPQVAIETNWDLETFMNELCEHKAGISKDDWKTGEADIYIFTAEVFKE